MFLCKHVPRHKSEHVGGIAKRIFAGRAAGYAFGQSALRLLRLLIRILVQVTQVGLTRRALNLRSNREKPGARPGRLYSRPANSREAASSVKPGIRTVAKANRMISISMGLLRAAVQILRPYVEGGRGSAMVPTMPTFPREVLKCT